jgi:hypothetical protein
VVAEAGGRFLLLAVLTSAGGGAVLWTVVRWVGRRGHAHGAIFFPGVVGLLYLLAEYPGGVQALQRGELWLIPLLDVAPVLIVLVALWWYGPHRWPRKLGPLGFRSGVEVALLPLALGTAADWGTPAAVERLLPAAAAELSPVSLLLSCGVALILGSQLQVASLQQAQALATALVTGPLQCRWQVEELTEVP